MRRLGAILVVAVSVTATGSGGGDTAPVAADEPASVAFVGDSIGRDAETEIVAAITATHPLAYVSAVGGGNIPYHLPRLVPVVQAADGPDIVVVELGTGDVAFDSTPQEFEANVRRFMRSVGPHVNCIAWLEQKPTPNRYYPEVTKQAPALNEVVRRVVPQFPNARYVHYAYWAGLAGEGPPYFLNDWLHLSSAGSRGLAGLIGSAVRGCDPDLTSGPFWDVADAFWAADAINWAAAEGLVAGFDNDTYRAVVGQFKPKVTRGQAARMIWRLRGEPQVDDDHGWSDVPPWLAPALAWGHFDEVLDGYPNGTFRPHEDVTRGRLVTWLWRAAGRPTGYLGDDPWPDAPQSLRRALTWAAAEAIVTGIHGEFRADGLVNRAQIAVWLRATDTFLHPAPPPPPTVPPTTLAPTTMAPTTVAPTTMAPTTVSPTTVSPTTLVP